MAPSLVAALALFYKAFKQWDLWPLARGTALCAVGALAVGYANYVILWGDPFGSRGIWTALFVGLAGVRCYLKGREVRLAAQISLSRLRRYREDQGLLKSVAAPGEARAGARFRPYAKVVLAGASVCGMGCLSLASALLATRDLLTTDDNPWWGPFAVVALLVFGVVLTGMGNSILRIGVQYFGKVISSPEDLTPGQYVLYLRSFEDDHRLARPYRIPLVGGWLTGWITISRGEEERLAAALSWAGPLVGVGAPGERVPPAGARRMYLPRHDWQDPVRRLMRGATLVVIVLGKGQGTRWEIGEAMRILPPERLILFVPMKEKEYEEFRSLAADWAPIALPPYERSRALTSRVRGVVYFRPGRQAEFAALQRPSLVEDQLVGSLDRALWPAMEQLTERDRRTGGTYG
jgi:hypothetical protein